jgi:hypothetical protein
MPWRQLGWWGGGGGIAPTLLSSVLGGGEWRKEFPVSIVQQAGWATELVWMQRLEEKSSASVRDQILVGQSVVRCYSD